MPSPAPFRAGDVALASHGATTWQHGFRVIAGASAAAADLDAARMELAGEYEAADGEYLKLIRDALKIAGHGLWTRYLEARRIPERTARERIQKAEGRFVASPREKPAVPAGSHGVSVIAEPVPVPPLPTWTAPAVALAGEYDADPTG